MTTLAPPPIAHTVRFHDQVGPVQVARRAGVRPSEVTGFFNRRVHALDDPGMSERILNASRALRYQPSDPAWRVRLQPQQGEFCFVLDASVSGGFTNEYFTRMINGALDRLGPMGRTLMFDRFDPAVDYAANPSRLPACVRAGSASRFLLAGTPNRSLTSWITRLGFPVVHLSRAVSLPGVCSVVPDFARAARWAVCYLASLGHRHLALAAAPHFRPGAWNTEELLRGAEEAAVIARLPGQVIPTLCAPAVPASESWGREVFERLRQMNPRPTAVFCLDDFTARDLMHAAWAAGWEIPRDLSVVGCNNVPSSLTTHPALTTFDLPVEEMGRVGVEQLGAMTPREATTRLEPPRTITLDVNLVARKTTLPFIPALKKLSDPAAPAVAVPGGKKARVRKWASPVAAEL